MDLEAGYYNKSKTLSVKKHFMENWWLSSKLVWSAQPAYGFAIHEFTYHLKLTPTNLCILSFSLTLSPPFPFSFLFAVLPSLVLHIIQTCS